ncbi:MAG: hypothetical protein JJ958_08315 [Balneola sp.]|jgi:hypothetical protein|nr:hypothetical protein [Balneola sp.]
MKSLFEYVYFLIYDFSKKFLGEDDIPEFKAFLFITLIESIWVINFFLMSELIPQLNLNWESFNLFSYLIAVFVIGFVNWFIYLKEKKYLQIYKANNQKRSLKKNSIVLSFLIFPIINPIILFLLNIL